MSTNSAAHTPTHDYSTIGAAIVSARECNRRAVKAARREGFGHALPTGWRMARDRAVQSARAAIAKATGGAA